jgi:hypothetical protein
MESFFFLFFTRVVGATLPNVGIARSIGPLCYSDYSAPAAAAGDEEAPGAHTQTLEELKI